MLGEYLFVQHDSDWIKTLGFTIFGLMCAYRLMFYKDKPETKDPPK